MALTEYRKAVRISSTMIEIVKAKLVTIEKACIMLVTVQILVA
jgi:hypothetical protein